MSSIYCFRLIVCPNKVKFLKSGFNWLDIIVVVSQWTVLGEVYFSIFLSPETTQFLKLEYV